MSLFARYIDMQRRFHDPEPGAGGGADPAPKDPPADPPADPAPADPAPKDPPADPPADPPKPKPSNEEARLLKEVMAKKAALKELEEKLRRFDGIDPEEVRALLAAKKQAEEAALESKGEWDRLKERMRTEHERDMAAVRAENEALVARLAERDRTVEDLTVGAQFANSPFIRDEMVLTPSKARVVYGSHFDIVDGSVVAFDKPRGATERTPLVDAGGAALPFEGAMKALIEADPDRDQILRAKMKPGSGSPPPKDKPAPKPPQSLSPAQKIAAGLAALPKPQVR